MKPAYHSFGLVGTFKRAPKSFAAPSLLGASGSSAIHAQERLQAARLFVDNLLTKEPLKPGLDRDTAVDVMWTYMATEHFRRLVRDRGWSADRYDHC